MTMSRFRKEDADRSPTAIYLLCGLSLVSFWLIKALPLDETERTRQSVMASRFMGEATRILKECRLEKGLPIDETADPNRTGLIGLEFSPLTTTRGLLPAKRTTTNPEMAALIVHLLKEAGAREGDPVAVGASGSFPGLILATLSATKAMELRPLIIYSLGTSQWGANNPEFHWLQMESCLREAGLFDFSPIAVSLGGERDIGEDWPTGATVATGSGNRPEGVLSPERTGASAERGGAFEALPGRREPKTFAHSSTSVAPGPTSASPIKF